MLKAGEITLDDFQKRVEQMRVLTCAIMYNSESEART